MNDNDNQSNNEEVIALRNQNLLLCAIHQALPEPVEQKIRSYLKKCLEKNPEVRFHGSLDRDSAISFFLYWIIEYDSEAYQGNYFLILDLQEINFLNLPSQKNIKLIM